MTYRSENTNRIGGGSGRITTSIGGPLDRAHAIAVVQTGPEGVSAGTCITLVALLGCRPRASVANLGR